MNRRKFVVGGGLLGFLGVVTSASTWAKEPEVKACTKHEYDESFLSKNKIFPFALGTLGGSNRSGGLVPCKHCNVMLFWDFKEIEGKS